MYDDIRRLLTTCWPGIIGALMSVYYTKPLCFLQGLASFLGGAAAAVALAPAFSGHVGDHAIGGISFLIGTFSMSVFGILFQLINRVRAAPIHTLSDFIDVLIDILLAFRHGRTRGGKDGN